jgi:hypothetical protein
MGHPSNCDKDLLAFINAINNYPKACERFIAADDSDENRSVYLDGRPKSEWLLARAEMSDLQRDINRYILQVVKGNLVANIVDVEECC